MFNVCGVWLLRYTDNYPEFLIVRFEFVSVDFIYFLQEVFFGRLSCFLQEFQAYAVISRGLIAFPCFYCMINLFQRDRLLQG